MQQRTKSACTSIYLKSTILGSVMFCGALSSAIAVAESADAWDASGYSLEEITVTARKRGERLQDTPISIVAFTERGLEDRMINNISQISEFTPNLTFETVSPVAGSTSSAVMFMRGIGQVDAIPTVDLGVGIYVDGVYLARNVGGVVDLLDVERIEVLRGPQGTLFGRNTIGGAISIVTKKPNEVLGGDASLTVGTGDRIDASFNLNVPFSDTFFVKVSGATNNQDGYVKRSDGIDLGDTNQLVGRLHMRWLASDNLEFNLVFDGTRERHNGAPLTLVDIDENADWPQFHNGFLVGPPCVPAPSPLDNPNCFNDQWLPPNIKDNLGTGQTFSDLDLWGVAFTVDWDLDWMSIKSITSYRDVDSEYAFDQDHSPIVIAQVDSLFEHQQFSQEFQFQGRALNDRLKWIVGLYYFEEEATSHELVTFPLVHFQSGGSVDNNSKAVFVQATYDITDRLAVTGGLRYTEDKKTFLPEQFVIDNLIGIPNGTPILPPVAETIKIKEETPMINLSYRWTEELMTYVTYSEGFKSGGFTQRVFPPLMQIPTYAPEFVKVYEAGFKYSGLQNRLRLNAAVFHTDYSDVQITVQETVAPVIRNAAKARIRGVEVDMVVMPAPGLVIETGLGYLDAEYRQVDANAVISVDNRLLKTPEWSLYGAVSYEVPLGNMGSLTPRVDWSYQSSVFNNAINSPQAFQKGYHLLNLGVAYDSVDGLWTASFMVRNVTNENYMTAAFSDVVFLGTSEAMFDRGREWALNVKRRF